MSDWDPRANEIFLAAIELASQQERQALLNERCAGDNDLRAQVESLLSASADAGDFLEQPVVDPAPTIISDEVRLDFLSPSDAPDSLGRLGEYEIASVIGRGGMGVVLEGRDSKLNRIVAIKVLAPEMAGNATARRRFLREAQAAAAVTHQQVVTIHAVSDDRLPYLVMEYIDGQSLQEKIEADGTLQLKEVLRIGAQIASGLAAAHAQGLIHRDIKPSNILLENGVERVRITDFGLARAVDDVSITGTGEVAGSPQYMSPEQAQGHTVDARSDLFSLGCVLYATCTGRSPFRATSTVAAIRRVCDESPRPIREVNPEVPGWLVEIIDRLLEKDPADRIQTAGEVSDLLSSYLAHVQDPESTPRPTSPAQVRASGGTKRSRFLLPAVALLLGVVGLYLTESTGITNLLRIRQRATTVETDKATGDEAVDTPDMPSVAPPAVGPRGEIDLLRLVDVNRDSVGGAWHFENGALVSPGTGRWDRLDIPYAPPDEYDLEVTAERKAGDGARNAREDMLSITLLSGEHQFFVGLDMFEGRLCGLGLVDGKDAFTNETTIEHAVFGDHLPHKIICRVRGGGVSVSVDGDVLIDWHGSLERLSIPDAGRTGQLGLMAMQSEYRFYDVILKPVRETTDSPPVITEVRTFEGHTGSVKQVAVARDGTLALSCSGVQGDESVRLWEVATGREIRSFDTSGRQILAVCFSHDEQRAVGAGFGGDISVWNVATGELITSFDTDKEVVTDLAVSPDGRHLLCATHRRAHPTARPVPDLSSAQLWDLDTEERVWQFDCAGWLETCRFLPDEHVIVAGRQTGCAMHLLNGETGDELRQFNLGDDADHQIEELAVSHDGQLIATASELGYVCLWDVSAGAEPVEYRSNMGNLRSVAFSLGDDRLLCAGGEGEAGSVQLLDLPDLQIVATVEHPGGLAWDIAYLPDGRHALSAGGWSDEGPGDYDLKLWRLPDATIEPPEITEVRSFEGHTGPVKQVAISPDGDLALSASGHPRGDWSVRLWEIETGNEIRTLETSGAQMMTVCFSPDGMRAAASGFGGVIHIWEVESGREITSISTETEVVEDLEFSPDGRQLLCATHSRRLPVRLNMSGFSKAQLWDAETDTLVWEHDSNGWLSTVAFLPGGEEVAVAGNVTGNAIQFLDRNTGRKTRHLNFGDPADNHAQEMAISPNDRFIALADSDGYVCLWDLWDLKEPGTPIKYRGGMGQVLSVSFSPDSSRLLCGTDEVGSIYLLEAPNLKTIASLENPAGLVWHVAYHPDGRHALSAGGYAEQRTEGDYALRLWRLPEPDNSPAMITGIRSFKGHTGPVNRVAFSRDGTLAVSGSGYQGDLTARLWEVATGRELHVLNADGRQIMAVCFSPDGQRVAGGGVGGIVYLWDVTSGDEIASFPTETDVVEDVAFSPDGRQLLCVAHQRTPESGSSDQGAAQLWDTESGTKIWQVDSGWLTTGEFLSDKRILIGGWGTGGAVHVLDRETGDELQVWQNDDGVPYRVQELAVSRDARFVATASELGNICLWDAESGGTPVEIKRNTGYLKSVSFSPDGRRILIGGQDGRIQLLDVPTLRTIASVNHPSSRVWSVAYAPDGRHALSAAGLAGEGLSAYRLQYWRLPEIGGNPSPPVATAVMSELDWYPTTHSGPVLFVAASPDGRVIATGSSDNTIQLFDRDKRALLHELDGHTAYELKFTSDGHQLLSAGDDNTVRLWDIETGDEIRRFVGHDAWVSSVDLSANGRTVLSGAGDGTIRFWDFESANQQHQIDVESNPVFSVRFDTEGERFVSAHLDGTVTIWNTATREEIRTITAHDGYAYVARFSPDGRTLLTTGDDGVACLWGIDSGRRLHTLPLEESVTEGEFLADGRFVLVSSRDKTISLWNVETGRQIARTTALTHLNTSIALLPGRQHFVSAGGLLRADTENGNRIWVGDGDYDIRLWQLPDLPGLPKFPASSRSMPEVARLQTTHTEPVFSIAVSPDGRVIATGSSDDTIHLFDHQTRATLQVLRGHFALGLRFTSDGRHLLSAGDDGTLRLWEVAGGEEITRFAKHAGWALGVDLSRDGRTVLSGGEDGTIRLWDLESGDELERINVEVEGETQAIFCVRYSNDGSRIVSAHHDGTVTQWDASTLEEITTISAHSGKAYTARLSPTGRILATSGNDDVGCVWDASSGRRLHTFPHAENVTIAEFIAGGRYVVTGSGDKTLRVWSAVTGQEVAHAIAPTHCTTAVALLPDGHLISAGGLLSARTEGGAPVWEGDGDYDLHVWRLPETVREALEKSPLIAEQIAELTHQIEQSPGDGSLRIARAQLYVRQSRWQDAADDLGTAGEAVYEEPGDGFLYAILLVHLEEHELHQQHCAKLLERFGETDDVWTANCLTKSCLLSPGVVDLDRLPMHLLSDDYGFASGEPGWVLSEARALFAYRAGDFERSRGQIRDTMDHPSYRDDPLYAPRALSILAMAAHGSGETDLARNLYEQATRQQEQIQLASDDIRAISWAYAEVLRREAAQVLEENTPTGHENGAFVIPGGVERTFDTLSDAVAASGSGDTIEIRGNGPFVTQPIVLRHALVLRAGAGFQPVIQRGRGLSLQDAALITTHASLVVEGLTFQHDLTDIENPKFLDSYDVNALRVANCRFVMTSQEGYAIAGEARDVDIRNCEFVMRNGYSVAFTCHPNGRWVVDNCVHAGTIGFYHPVASTFRIDAPDSQQPASIQLSRNTVVAKSGVYLGRFERASLPDNESAPAPIVIHASSNVFDTWSSVFLSSFRIADAQSEDALPPADAATLPARLIDWRGEQNVFPARGSLILLRYYNRLESSEKSHANSLPEWDSFWGSTDDASVQGEVRFAAEYRDGEFITESDPDYAGLTAAHLRLHPDSAGYQAGPDGQNLGADVDFVGPDEAWDRWKQTSEYAEWLEESQALLTESAAPATVEPELHGAFVLCGDTGREEAFVTLAEAVDRSTPGNAIEIRGNGPFDIGSIVINHALAIRAGPGFRPVIRRGSGQTTDNSLLVPRGPLVLEGLEFRETAVDNGWPRFVDAHGDVVLRIANCRFVNQSIPGSGITGNTRDVAIRNCGFVIPHGYSLLFTSSANSRFIIDNCTHIGAIGFYHPSMFPTYVKAPDAANPTSIQIRRNSVDSWCALWLGLFGETSMPQAPDAGRPILVETSENLLNVPNSFAFLSGFHSAENGPADGADATLQLRSAAEAHATRTIDWREERNVFSAGSELIRFRVFPERGRPAANREPARSPPPLQASTLLVNKGWTPVGISNLSAWNDLWGHRQAGSLEGHIRFWGGSLWARAQAEGELVPAEDFRLHPDSAGYQAGPDGKDLGADIDFVGPGEAYERWKQTAEYGEWLEETQVLMIAAAVTPPIVEPIPPPAEPGAFVLLAKGDVERTFDTIAAAIARSRSGDVVEVRGNGPFTTDGVKLHHRLTIRAAAGYQPVIRQNLSEQAPDWPLVLTTAPLILEGITFKRWPDAATPLTGANLWGEVMRTERGGELYVCNCRLLNVRGTCLEADSNVTLRNCELIIPPGDGTPAHPGDGSAMRFGDSTGNRTVMSNSVFNRALEVVLQPDDHFQLALELTDNTFLRHGITFMLGPFPFESLLEESREPFVNIEARQNLWGAGVVTIRHHSESALSHSEENVHAAVRRLIGWQDGSNVYPAGTHLFSWLSNAVPGPGQFVANRIGDDLSSWMEFWELTDTGSLTGSLRFAGGDVLETIADDHDQLTAKDLRLLPSSTGYKAGPDGKDLGADISIVGPGEAYERWKQTPEYREWLQETGQLP